MFTGEKLSTANVIRMNSTKISYWYLLRYSKYFLYLIKLIIHVGYCQVWISKELKQTQIKSASSHLLHDYLLVSVLCFYLLFKVKQGLSVRLQHGIHPCAERPQVNSMKTRLIGLVCVMFLRSKACALIIYIFILFLYFKTVHKQNKILEIIIVERGLHEEF